MTPTSLHSSNGKSHNFKSSTSTCSKEYHELNPSRLFTSQESPYIGKFKKIQDLTESNRHEQSSQDNEGLSPNSKWEQF